MIESTSSWSITYDDLHFPGDDDSGFRTLTKFSGDWIMLTMSTLDLEGCGRQGQSCLRSSAKKSLTWLWYEIWLPPLRSPSFAKRCQSHLSSLHPVDRARGQAGFAEWDHLANQVRNLHLIFPKLDDATYGMNNLLLLVLPMDTTCTPCFRSLEPRWI